MIAGVRPKERFEVLEVREGRPWRVLRQDCVTGEVWEEEWVKGHRPPSVVVHQYDPLSALGDGND